MKVNQCGDAMCMVTLVRRIPKSNLETVYSDKAYITRENVQFIHDVGAYAAIEPKKNLTISSRGHRAYEQLIREYPSDPEEWRRSHSYGKRSLAETVFSMMKQSHGVCLRSQEAAERVADPSGPTQHRTTQPPGVSRGTLTAECLGSMTMVSTTSLPQSSS